MSVIEPPSLSIQPDGGFEVLAVPITIANSGARDGAVLALQLDVKNLSTGLTARFEATYTVDATYFAAKGDRRPKTPFSALVIAGRSAWTGTVLFYPVSYSDERALTPIATDSGVLSGDAHQVCQGAGRCQQH